jgi:hypothetical protein
LRFELGKEVILLVAFIIPEIIPEARTGVTNLSVDCRAICLALGFIHPCSVTALRQNLCIILTGQARRFLKDLMMSAFCNVRFQSKSACHVNIVVRRRHPLCGIFDCSELISLHRNRLVAGGFFGLLTVRFRAVIASRRTVRLAHIGRTLLRGISRNSSFGPGNIVLSSNFLRRG